MGCCLIKTNNLPIIYYLLFEHIKCTYISQNTDKGRLKKEVDPRFVWVWEWCGAKFVCTSRGHSFVDDTDLLHINMEEDETVEEAHEALQ